MAKEKDTTNAAANAAGAAAAVAKESAAVVNSADSTTRHEEIARLAYSYWQARGCPEGSPEQDWLRAENELESQALATSA